MGKQSAVIFILVFFVVAIVYAFLASFATVLYRNKQVNELSSLENDILFGRATIVKRLLMFVITIFSSFYFPPCYIIAGFAVGIY
ncbi:MAG: hypothetical protein ACYSTS_19725 [Planctomycetota bacterium]|jgi:hypothetical protein